MAGGWIWCSTPGGRADEAHRRRVETDALDPDRFTAARAWPFSMRELAEKGVCAPPAPKRGQSATPHVLRVYLRKPTDEQLLENARERRRLDEEHAHRVHVAAMAERARPARKARARKATTDEQTRDEKRREIDEILRLLREEGRRLREEYERSWGRPEERVVVTLITPGHEALEALGLDPRTATRDGVQRIFRAVAKSEHPDHGGDGDMGKLVQLKNDALEHIATRG